MDLTQSKTWIKKKSQQNKMFYCDLIIIYMKFNLEVLTLPQSQHQ